MASVAVLGLGDLGSAVARRLVDTGHKTCGFDPDLARAAEARRHGVSIALSPAQAALAATDVVVLLVKTADHAEAACRGADGCLPHLGGKALVVMSSLDPAYVRELSRAVRQAGGTLVDAPSAGGAPAALRGELSLMVAGGESARERAAEVLAALGSVQFLGAVPGRAQTAKMLTQLTMTANLAAVHEALRMGAVLGLPEEHVLAALVGSSGTSFVAANWGFLSEFLTDGHIGNISKDLRTLLAASDALGVQAPVAHAAHEALQRYWPLNGEPGVPSV